MTEQPTIKVCVVGHATAHNWKEFVSGQEMFGLKTDEFSKGRHKWIAISDASNRDSIFRVKSLTKIQGPWEWTMLPSPPPADVEHTAHCAIHLSSGETIITRESAAEIEQLIENA